MASFEISCEHCGSRYALPTSLREALRGMSVTCSVCTREWTPLPADGRGVFGGPRPGGSMPSIALHHYLQSNPYSYAAAPAGAVAPAAAGTVDIPASTAGGPALRVAATGPDFELRATYELGSRSFLVGRRGCHLDLLRADELPERAIRIRRSDRGFEFEGLGGFLIPLGPVRISSGRIDPGSRLELELGPYRVELEPSNVPGHPIADLEGAAPARPSPAPAPVAPVADMSQTVRGLGSMLALELAEPNGVAAKPRRRSKPPATTRTCATRSSLPGRPSRSGPSTRSTGCRSVASSSSRTRTAATATIRARSGAPACRSSC